MSKMLAPLRAAVHANVPVVVIGEPGTAKTAKIEGTLAPSLDMRCETVISSIRDVTDFSGLPIIGKDGVTFAPPSFAKRILDNRQPTLLFFDEISTAPPACQAGVLRIINERWIGDTRLPDSCRIIAAMNPQHTSAGGGELTAPLANRFCHFPWSLDHDDWIAWVVQRSQAHVTIGGFIRTKPQSLLVVPKNENDLGKPWPSPRTWDMAGRLMMANLALNGSGDNEIFMVAGCVGEGNALEFLNWRKQQDLPDPETLLRKPDAWKVPERGDTVFTILASITQAALSNLTKERYLAAWTLYHKAANAGKKDTAASSILPLLRAGGTKIWIRDADVTKATNEMLKPFIALLKQAGLMGTAEGKN